MKMEARNEFRRTYPQNGMLFYESRASKVQKIQEMKKKDLIKNENIVKEMMFDYNHCRPGNRESAKAY